LEIRLAAPKNKLSEAARLENVNDFFAEFTACLAGTLEGDGAITHSGRLDCSEFG
jgi:hypothetical protein